MPVLRKRERIRADYSGQGVLQTRQNPSIETARGQARSLAKRANEYGALMATEAKDKGIALAKAATFAGTVNGVPDMPERAVRDMGNIAQKAYDATIKERFAFQMTTAVRAQLAQVENENLYDNEAYTEAAQNRIDTMAQDVPEGMEGTFQKITTGALANSSINIGRRVAQSQMADAKTSYPVMVKSQAEQIKELLLSGNDNAAQALVEGTDWIDAIPVNMATEADKLKMKDELFYTAGWTRILRDLDVPNLPAADLVELRERMASGMDDELLKYFTDKDGNPRRDLMKSAMREIAPFVQQATARAAAAGKNATARADLNLVLDGGASGSKRDGEVFDAYLAEQLNLTDPTNPGSRRAMVWQDWMGMDQQTRNLVMPQIKTSGFLPPSLKSAMLRMSRQQDPAELEQTFLLLRDLEEAPNTAGKSISLMGEVPDELVTLYRQASVLAGDGAPGQDSISLAISKVDAMRDMAWDDEQLSRFMNKDNGWKETWGWDEAVTQDNARSVMSNFVKRVVFDDEGIEPTPKELATTIRLFEDSVKMGNSFEAAASITRQGMKDRYVESEYFSGVSRSAYAPEKYYATPPASTVMGLLRNADQWTAGQIAGMAETLAETPFNMIPGGLPKWLEVDLGADRFQAEPRDMMIDTEIRNLLAERPDLEGAFDTGRGVFVAGRDYLLLPNKSAGVPPVYTVSMLNPDGVPVPIGVVDIRDSWQAFTEFSQAAEIAQQAANQRGQDFLLSNDPAAAKAWSQVWENQRNGQDTDFNAMLDGLFKDGGGR